MTEPRFIPNQIDALISHRDIEALGLNYIGSRHSAGVYSSEVGGCKIEVEMYGDNQLSATVTRFPYVVAQISGTFAHLTHFVESAKTVGIHFNQPQV